MCRTCMSLSSGEYHHHHDNDQNRKNTKPSSDVNEDENQQKLHKHHHRVCGSLWNSQLQSGELCEQTFFACTVHLNKSLSPFGDYFGDPCGYYCCEDHDDLDSDNLGDLTGDEHGDHHGDHGRNECGDYLGGDCEDLNADSLGDPNNDGCREALKNLAFHRKLIGPPTPHPNPHPYI